MHVARVDLGAEYDMFEHRYCSDSASYLACIEYVALYENRGNLSFVRMVILELFATSPYKWIISTASHFVLY